VIRSIRLLVVALLVLAGAAVGVLPASAAPIASAACPPGGGSVPRAVPDLGVAPLVAVRPGRHACYDRVVFEVDGPVAGYDIRYVRQVVQDGSGAVVPVRGGARLQVILHHPAHDEAGRPTWSGDVDVRGFSTLRSVVDAGSFEGYTTFGVGTRARLPFRVFVLPGPHGHSRLVLDVAHSWR
jgi:hypothetical protein